MMVAFSQVKPNTLKLRALPQLPSRLLEGPGIAIETANGAKTISVDFSGLERDDITDPTNLYVGTWDATESIFKLVLATNLKGEQGDQGIPGPVSEADYATNANVEAATIAAPLMYLRTAGYAAAGDGGGALYKRGVGPAGTGKIQSADGAWWLITETVINVLALGAKGDNSNDDTAAIQAGVNFLTAGGVLYFPRPSVGYKVTGAITLKENIVIRGDGAEISRICPSGSSYAVFQKVYGSEIFIHARFEGICIDASVNSATSITGIKTVFASNINYVSCTFIGLLTNIFADRGRHFTVLNCIARDSASLVGNLRFIDSTGLSYIQWVHIVNYQSFRTSGSSQVTDPPIQLVRCAAGQIIDVFIYCSGTETGIAIENDCQGIEVTNVILLVPYNGISLLKTTVGAAVNAHPNNIMLTQVHIDQAVSRGITIEGTSVCISQANITGTPTNAIEMFTGSGIITVVNSNIVGNNVVGSNGIAINNGVTYFSIIGNIISNFPGAAVATGATSDHYLITNNIMYSCGAISSAGTNGTVNNNV